MEGPTHINVIKKRDRFSVLQAEIGPPKNSEVKMKIKTRIRKGG